MNFSSSNTPLLTSDYQSHETGFSSIFSKSLSSSSTKSSLTPTLTPVANLVSTPQEHVKETIIFRPKEVKFTAYDNHLHKGDLYCKFKLGWNTDKSSIASYEEGQPMWIDVIPLKRKHKEQFAKVKVKDKSKALLSLDVNLGETKIDLEEVEKHSTVSGWYNLYKGDKITGQIFLEVEEAFMDI